MNSSPTSMLTIAWFGLIGLFLIFYVITDGFDLGVGILSLFTKKEEHRDSIFASIAHVWDANETWLVALGGALFGAFPGAYAMLLQSLYVPIMVLIASLILRGAAIEFRHAAHRKRGWDLIFGIGSLLAAVTQGVILGKVITGLAPGIGSEGFTVIAAVGVTAGYALLGATYLVKKVSGQLEQIARRYTVISMLLTAASAILLSAGTMLFSPIVQARWAQPGVFHVLVALATLAILSFVYIAYALRVGSVRGPFRASVLIFIVSFAGLAISLFPSLIPGQLTITAAASENPTLVFMLLGIGTVLPIMIGYNLYQYHVFRGKVVAHH